MAREFNFLSSLPLDSNFAFLEFPATIGKLRYATIHAWQTEGSYLVNVGTIDKAERVSTGENFEIGGFWGLYFLQVANSIASVGNDDAADLATWRILPESEILLYRYALPDYPLNPESDDSDARAVRLIETLGAHSNLIAYRRIIGTEVQNLHFTG